MATPPRVLARAPIFSFLLCAVITLAITAQSNRTTQNSSQNPNAQTDWARIDAELKVMLNEYYAGKLVRAKVVIPANKQGLEILDGQLRVSPVSNLELAIQPGELLLIKEMKFKNKSIEISFDSSRDSEPASGPPPNLSLAPVGVFGSQATDPAKTGEKSPLLNNQPLAGARQSPNNNPRPSIEPRITLKFSREISTRDLNLQSINRWLAVAVDTTSLVPAPDPAPRAAVTAEASPAPTARPDASTLAERAAAAQGIQKAPLTGNIITAQPNVSELNIECSVPGARLYIDGDFSGTVPRTVRLLMGVHTVFILAPGYDSWEQKFFIPAGKAALIRAQLKPLAKP